MKNKIISALSGLALLASTSCASNISALSEKINKSYAVCIDNKYDYDRKCLEKDIEEAYIGVYPLHVKITLKDKITGEEIYSDIDNGSGILLEGGYVLTVYHVSHEDNDFLSIIGELSVEIYLKTLDNEKYLLKEIVGDEEVDGSLLKMPENAPKLPEYTQKFGNSDELEMGQFTYLVGNAADEGINVRPGVVSQLKIEGSGAFGTSFGIANSGNYADSGGPVFALRDGELEIVGLFLGLLEGGNNISYATPINLVLERLEKNFGKKLPIKNK